MFWVVVTGRVVNTRRIHNLAAHFSKMFCTYFPTFLILFLKKF
jgi:hypothetical protein